MAPDNKDEIEILIEKADEDRVDSNIIWNHKLIAYHAEQMEALNRVVQDTEHMVKTIQRRQLALGLTKTEFSELYTLK